MSLAYIASDFDTYRKVFGGFDVHVFYQHRQSIDVYVPEGDVYAVGDLKVSACPRGMFLVLSGVILLQRLGKMFAPPVVDLPCQKRYRDSVVMLKV